MDVRCVWLNGFSICDVFICAVPVFQIRLSFRLYPPLRSILSQLFKPHNFIDPFHVQGPAKPFCQPVILSIAVSAVVLTAVCIQRYSLFICQHLCDGMGDSRSIKNTVNVGSITVSTVPAVRLGLLCIPFQEIAHGPADFRFFPSPGPSGRSGRSLLTGDPGAAHMDLITGNTFAGKSSQQTVQFSESPLGPGSYLLFLKVSLKRQKAHSPDPAALSRFNPFLI